MDLRRSLVLLAVVLVSPGLLAQPSQSPPASNLSIHFEPALELPIGSSAPLYNMGGSVGLSARYLLPGAPLVYLTGGLDYSMNPLKMDAALNKLSAGAGVGVHLGLGSRLALVAFGTGGYSYDFISLESGTEAAGSPYISAGAGAEMLLNPRVGVGLGAVYRNYFGLYSAVGAYAGSSYHFPAKEKLKARKTGPGQLDLLGAGQVLQLSQIQFENIFPVFRKYYDDRPIGTATLKNPYNKPVTDIRVTLFVRQYMDEPKACQAPRELPAGASQPVQLNALFTDKVLDITEATKAAVVISVEYTYDGRRYKDDLTDTIRVFDRNAMTWDDDRKAAAFVTAKDPMVLTFSKNVAGMIKDKGSRAVDPNLQLVVAMQRALSLYGMTYIRDPKTPYAEFSKKTDVIDYLQFPRQSLEYKAGDCDDLSILYSAILHAMGVETAFLTIPGHIFVAVALQLSEDQARKTFLNPDELIYREDKVWLPLEATELRRGFLEAWQAGVQQWKEHSAKNQAGFFPVSEAWKLYEPVGLPPGRDQVALPPDERIVSGYLQEVMRFIDREIMPRVGKLQADISRTGSARAMNNLGVLYARYGMQDKAEEQFQAAVRKEELVPALINLGNIEFLKGDMNRASVYYDRAYRRAPDNATVLLCVARVSQELGRFELAQQTFRRLEQTDPEMAKQFAYLNLTGAAASRAADASGLKEKVLWEDE